MPLYHKVKGFSLSFKQYPKVEKSLTNCLKLRNEKIKQKQDQAMKFIEESKLTFDIKKRHFFNEADILIEMLDFYENHLKKNAGKLPPKDV